LTDLGIGRASDLRVLLNINEANGGNKMPITIDSLVLTAYDQNGNSVFSASMVNGPMTLDQFKHGQGANSDFVFGLDAEAAARLQAAMKQDSNLRLGLTAALSNVNGGRKDSRSAPHQAGTRTNDNGAARTGLAGLAGAARRRRKAAALKAEGNAG